MTTARVMLCTVLLVLASGCAAPPRAALVGSPGAYGQNAPEPCARGTTLQSASASCSCKGGKPRINNNYMYCALNGSDDWGCSAAPEGGLKCVDVK